MHRNNSVVVPRARGCESAHGTTDVEGTFSFSGQSNRDLPSEWTLSSGVLPDGSTATLNRTTPDGTWTYAQVKGGLAASTTTQTDPQGNQTVIQFQGNYETKRQTYQGSTSGTLLQTINTCYNGAAFPCTGTAITVPLTQRTITTILPGPANLQAQHVYLYNSTGSLTEQDDYDWGSGGGVVVMCWKIGAALSASGISNLARLAGAEGSWSLRARSNRS